MSGPMSGPMSEPKQFLESSIESAGSRSTSLDIDYEAEKRLLRKLDWHVIPAVAPIYIFSFLDRINIGNARLYGMEEDLKLSSHQFSVAVAVLFVTYIAVEIPSNVVIKIIGASRWVAVITFFWGVVATFTGFVHNYASLLACRMLLGAFEGGFVPGIILYLTLFYTKREMALRIGMFLVNGAVAGAFGGLLAYAIGHMDGIDGKRGWRWIMIIEGIPTALLGIAAWFYLADSPETARYLTPEDRSLVRKRLHRENGFTETSEILQKADVVLALTDWKNWLLCLATFFGAVMMYGYATFLPTIIHGIDPTYSVPMVQVMTIPCYAAGVSVFLVMAWFSDRIQHRGTFAVFFSLVAVSGYAILLGSHNTGAQYFACFVIPMGIYVVMCVSVAWIPSNNVRYGKRTTSIAMATMSANCGGILMAFLYPRSDGPRYKRGHTTTLSLVAVASVLFAFYSLYLGHINRRRAAGEEDYKVEGLTSEQIDELGDRSPRFRFTT